VRAVCLGPRVDRSCVGLSTLDIVGLPTTSVGISWRHVPQK